MARLRLIRQYLHRFARLEGRRRLLLVEAALSLFAAWLALKVLPFSSVARRLGVFALPQDPRAARGLTMVSPEQQSVASDIGWAVKRAARHVPFRAVCLQQAIAAHAMLARRGVAGVVHFGAAKASEAFEYHAWLDAAGIEVTGYPVARDFTEIACFV